MLPYVLLIAIPFILQHRISANIVSLDPTSKKSNRSALIVFWIWLFFMIAFRHETIGNDNLVYNRIFDFIEKSNWVAALGRSPEVGYSFLNKLISLFTDDFRWVLIIGAFLSVLF